MLDDGTWQLLRRHRWRAQSAPSPLARHAKTCFGGAARYQVLLSAKVRVLIDFLAQTLPHELAPHILKAGRRRRMPIT